MIFCELSIPNRKSHNVSVTHIIPTSLQSEETVAPRLFAVDEKTPIQSGTAVQTQGKAEVGETQTAKDCAYSAVDEHCWFVSPPLSSPPFQTPYILQLVEWGNIASCCVASS